MSTNEQFERGALVVPVSRARRLYNLDNEPVGRLIEPARVELVDPPAVQVMSLNEALASHRRGRFTIDFGQGPVCSFEGHVSQWEIMSPPMRVVDVTSHSSIGPWRQMIATALDMGRIKLEIQLT